MSKKGHSTDYKASVFADDNIIITKAPLNKHKKKEKVTELQPVVSKSVLRKLAKIAREKESKKHRLNSLEILQEHQFDGDKRVLLDQSGVLGSERTKNEELARLYALRQQGIKLSSRENAQLSDALLEYGDIEGANSYVEKQKGKITSYAHKTMTSNPFMPLSTASATITATIQERLLTGNHDGKNANNGERKVYSRKELSKIADQAITTDFDDSFKKKLKKRLHREETLIVNDKLKKLNSKKLHEMSSDDDDADTNDTPMNHSLNPDKLIVLPKELRGLSDAINIATGGKVKAMTSNVQNAQMGRGQRKALIQDNQESEQVLNPDKINDSIMAAAALISKGLLTNKNKNTLDDLFAMSDFSSDEDDENAKPTNLSSEQQEWGVSTQLPKKEAKSTQSKKNKKQSMIDDDDEFVSAASAVKTQKAPPTKQQLVEESQNNDNSTVESGDFDENGNPIYKSYVPQGLAMPTLTRTSKAAVITKTLPIAVLANSIKDSQALAHPIIIHKRQKGNKIPVDAQKSVQLPNIDYNALQRKENEYKVNFNVLKSKDVLDYLDTVEQINRGTFQDSESDLDDEEKMNKYSRLTILDATQEEQAKPAKKRKILFDFSQPITVGAPVVKSAASLKEELIESSSDEDHEDQDDTVIVKKPLSVMKKLSTSNKTIKKSTKKIAVASATKKVQKYAELEKETEALPKPPVKKSAATKKIK